MAPYTSLARPTATPLAGTPTSVIYIPSAGVSTSPRPQALWPEQYTFGKRQSQQAADLPVCARCLEEADQEGCSTIACLCGSSTFLNSVTDCFTETCQSAGEWNMAYMYAQQYCLNFGITVPSSVITALPAETSAAAPPQESDGPIGEVVAPGPQPTVYTTRSKSTLTVDVVMGCVCSSLLALALILGGVNIYKMHRFEQTQSQLGSRPFTQVGTQMSHLKSYNNFEYDPTKTTHSAFAAGPARGKSMNRGHDLTHLDASAFNSYPRASDDDKIHVHTATTVETTPVSATFPHGSEDGLTTTTVHLGENVEVPVLERTGVQFVLDEDSDKEEKKVEGRKKKSVNRL